MQRFRQVLELSESTFIQGAGFGKVETFAIDKLAEAMDLNTKGVEPMLNLLKRERGRDSIRLVRISMFDSYEN